MHIGIFQLFGRQTRLLLKPSQRQAAVQVAKAEQPVAKNFEISLVLRCQFLIGLVELPVKQAGQIDLHQGENQAGDKEAPVKTEQGTTGC